MFFNHDEMDRINAIIAEGAASKMTDREFIAREVMAWIDSPKRLMQLDGERYYDGDHDILNRKREIIGENGELQEVKNLPNNKLIDNQYAKMVDQKVNYVFGKPITYESENETYVEKLKKIFNKKFQRTLGGVAMDAYNGGLCWIHPYYDSEGNFKFKKFPAYEILPFWKDADHTELDAAVRYFKTIAYEGDNKKTIEHVEVYDTKGIWRYVLDGGKLIPDVENPSTYHVVKVDENGDQKGLNWQRIPLIAFKSNRKEIPLIKRVKSLQDGINIMLSDFENNMQEDNRNTILILKNYDGQNLGEFRKNLSQYGAIKVRSVDGSNGGVETLKIEVNSTNYESILKLFKKALIENARGFDAKDDRLNTNPNEMNLRSMYSDIDLDANAIETEFQASIEELLWFVNNHLANSGEGDFEDEEIKVIFDRDTIVNESEIITNCKNSVGIISDETIVANHPYTKDVQDELDKLKKQKESELEEYGGGFGNDPKNPADPQNTGGEE